MARAPARRQVCSRTRSRRRSRPVWRDQQATTGAGSVACVCGPPGPPAAARRLSQPGLIGGVRQGEQAGRPPGPAERAHIHRLLVDVQRPCASSAAAVPDHDQRRHTQRRLPSRGSRTTRPRLRRKFVSALLQQAEPSIVAGMHLPSRPAHAAANRRRAQRSGVSQASEAARPVAEVGSSGLPGVRRGARRTHRPGVACPTERPAAGRRGSSQHHAARRGRPTAASRVTSPPPYSTSFTVSRAPCGSDTVRPMSKASVFLILSVPFASRS